MSGKQSIQVKKLTLLLDQLEHGKNVQNRELKALVGAEHCEVFETLMREQLEMRDNLAN
jgi:hypothetical protein